MRRDVAPPLRERPPVPPPPPNPYGMPSPPIISEPLPRRKPRPQPQPRPVEVPREAPSLDSLPTTSLPVEQIKIPELQVSEYHEFKTASSEVQAIPWDKKLAPAKSGRARPKPADALSLRALLRNPNNIRTAILLREILGPAPGLQSPRSGHTFPTP